MGISAVFQFLIPKDRKFFPMFERASLNLLSAAVVFSEAVHLPQGDKRSEKMREVSKLEHAGDEIAHEIFHELAANFITPFDREDIHSLTSAIDDILDCMNGCAKRIDLYQMGALPPALGKLSELLLTACRELHLAVGELKSMKNAGKIREALVRIHSVENHADDLFDAAVAKSFLEEKNAVEVIKTKEILSAVETATDKCEDAANVLESIIVKNA